MIGRPARREVIRMKLPATAGPFPIVAVALVVLGIASLVLVHQLVWVAAPAHDIHLAVTPEEAAARSADFLRDLLGHDVSGYSQTTVFRVVDGPGKTYLEQQFGVARTTALSDELVLWAFITRYFRQSYEESFFVTVAQDGRVVGYEHRIGDAVPGASLTHNQALEVAEVARRDLVAVEGDWRLFGESSTELAARRDWTFTWVRTDRQLPVWVGPDGRDPAQIRLEIVVHGDRADGVRQYLAVPGGWARERDQINSTKALATKIDARLGFWPLALLALVVCVCRLVRRDLQWRTAVTLAIVAVVVQAVAVVNQLPEAMLDYDTTMSWAAFLGTKIWHAARDSVWEIVLFGLAGEALYRQRLPRQLTLQASFSWRGAMTRGGAIALGVGALTGVVSFAYQPLYYLLGSHVGFWSPAAIRHVAVYISLVPWLLPLPDAYDAAIREDFTFRLFAIPVLTLLFVRVLRRERASQWLAIVVSAFAWGFLHTQYPHTPFFARALEVSLVGILVGWLMVRFGILAPIAAHFTDNALIYAYSIEDGGSILFSLLAYSIVGIPLAVAMVAAIRARLRGSFVSEEDLLNESLSRRLAASSTGEPRHGRRPFGTVRHPDLAWVRCVVRALGGVGVTT
jgi:hypothetical protein